MDNHAPRRRLRLILGWLLGLCLVIPVALYFAFLALLEMSERQWLGRAPQQQSTNVRLQDPHDLALLDVGSDSLATRLRLIAAAKSSIDMEFFIYELDTASRLVSNALIERAQAGVRIRVIVDFAKPVFKLRPHLAEKLAAAGIAVRYYNTAGLARFFAMQHRTHRKMLIVDGTKAMVGGRNIGDDYFDLSHHYNFLDSDLLVEGPIVTAMVASFQHYWQSQWIADPMSIGEQPAAVGASGNSNSGEKSQDALADLWWHGSPGDQQTAAEILGRPPRHRWHRCDDIQFVTDHPGPGVERRVVFQEIVKLAQEAKHTIRLESPYVVVRNDGLQVIHGIVDSGVKLQLLTNGLHSTDAYYTVAALIPSLGDLRRPGLELYAYQGEALPSQDGRGPAIGNAPAGGRWGLHAKRAVFDDRVVVVGSYNIDPRSANLNSELILICRGSGELAAEARKSFEERKGQAVAILGTDQARGLAGLLDRAERDKVLLTYAVLPLARLLDFLL